MRVPLLGLFGGLCLTCATVFAQTEPAPAPVATPVPVDEFADEAIVNRVIDGSTLDAQVNGQRVAIGYVGVQTPPGNQPCGQIALSRNRELVGQRVLLMSDPVYGFDDAGRRLFYVFTAEGLSIDELLIREGLGRAVRTDGLEGTNLEAAEADAAANARGCVWASN
jgi:micrococcal nuclease